MPLEVKRKQRENIQGLVRRFSQKIRQSGILLQARKNQFKSESKSNEAKKKAALRRIELRKQYNKLKKLGQLKKGKKFKR